MPPANSPNYETTRAANSSPTPFLQQLEIISTPPIDLAATLMSHPEDSAHDQNVSFLRGAWASYEEQNTASDHSRDLGWSRVSDPSVPSPSNVNTLRRYHRSNREGDRVPIVRRRSARPGDYRELPSQYSQSVYGWSSEIDDEFEESSGPSSAVLQRMWHFRDIGRVSTRSLAPTYESRRPSSRPAITANSEEEARRNRLTRYDFYRDPALVTAALLQSVRRNPRIPGRQVPDSRSREDDDFDDLDDDRQSQQAILASRGIHPRSPPSIRGELYRNELRRKYLKDPSIDRLREAIQYLDRVRFSSSYEESLSSAAAGGFVQFDYFLRNEDDFILNTDSIAAPAECSWLKPGAVFSGHQQATNSCSPRMLSHRVSESSRITNPTTMYENEGARITVHTSSGRRYWARNSVDLGRSGAESVSNPNPKTEHWPVKVTIHNIDYSTMTLSGTMEAYNIPDKTASNQSAHIVTFLEGEIIDFNTHTLETKNFNAGPEIDSCYWREIEPFKDQTYDEIVKNLVSKKWLAEKLAKGWILMRWKERCFVSPSHSRQGLTIGGFYYISIRRDNGRIEGMYYDPGSSPYQQLTLEPVMKQKMVFPAYSFR
ncbi:hypothetical protein LOZ58_003080 [Ophidiomyces ophidiicola]|nr:hypothetical protein LOZ65_006248 [Ophidiomyces ophidiicola]KAI1939035.1 hypothetical protein LOZ66_003112 [Ophidiomyces ophidiicola]KAI1962002.1 hypothetical protein LOZ58_003080 [Ophidiomyces ophidiicola]